MHGILMYLAVGILGVWLIGDICYACQQDSAPAAVGRVLLSLACTAVMAYAIGAAW